MSWRGAQGGIDAAKQGHDVVMPPNTHLYFDYYQSKDEGEPIGIGGFIPVEKVYSLNPIPEELNEEEAKHILGAQGNIWTEYIKTPEHVKYMTLPGMTALSEIVWTSPEKRNWEEFKERLNLFKNIYEEMNLNYAPHVFESTDKRENETSPTE